VWAECTNLGVNRSDYGTADSGRRYTVNKTTRERREVRADNQLENPRDSSPSFYFGSQSAHDPSTKAGPSSSKERSKDPFAAQRARYVHPASARCEPPLYAHQLWVAKHPRSAPVSFPSTTVSLAVLNRCRITVPKSAALDSKMDIVDTAATLVRQIPSTYTLIPNIELNQFFGHEDRTAKIIGFMLL
jgi:hypothetical protein